MGVTTTETRAHDAVVSWFPSALLESTIESPINSAPHVGRYISTHGIVWVRPKYSWERHFIANDIPDQYNSRVSTSRSVCAWIVSWPRLDPWGCSTSPSVEEKSSGSKCFTLNWPCHSGIFKSRGLTCHLPHEDDHQDHDATSSTLNPLLSHLPPRRQTQCF